jgi:hypothetical protein
MSWQTRPWRLSVSYDQRRLIGGRFSKTIGAIRSEKSISIIGFEKGKLLNLRCACHGRCLAHNRSISRNERSDTLDPCIKSILSSIVQIQLPSFPFGCYTNPLCAFSWHEVTDDRDTGSGGHRPASTDRGTAPTAAPAVRGAGERDGGGVLLPQLVEAIETDLSAAPPPARRMLYSNL